MGLPINQVRSYTVAVEQQSGALGVVRTQDRARLIDPNNVTQVNTLRMPFSSGKLQLSLDNYETANKVGITSQTGAAAAVSSATTIVESASKLD